MAAPKTPNPTAGAAAVQRKALERKAAELLAAGWFLAAPEKAGDVRTALESVGCYEEDWSDRAWTGAADAWHAAKVTGDRRVFLRRSTPLVSTEVRGTDEPPSYGAVTFGTRGEALKAAQLIGGPGRRVAVRAANPAT
jgi:hypothetical protein